MWVSPAFEFSFDVKFACLRTYKFFIFSKSGNFRLESKQDSKTSVFFLVELLDFADPNLPHN